MCAFLGVLPRTRSNPEEEGIEVQSRKELGKRRLGVLEQANSGRRRLDSDARETKGHGIEAKVKRERSLLIEEETRKIGL